MPKGFISGCFAVGTAGGLLGRFAVRGASLLGRPKACWGASLFGMAGGNPAQAPDENEQDRNQIENGKWEIEFGRAGAASLARARDESGAGRRKGGTKIKFQIANGK